MQENKKLHALSNKRHEGQQPRKNLRGATKSREGYIIMPKHDETAYLVHWKQAHVLTIEENFSSFTIFRVVATEAMIVVSNAHKQSSVSNSRNRKFKVCLSVVSSTWENHLRIGQAKVSYLRKTKTQCQKSKKLTGADSHVIPVLNILAGGDWSQNGKSSFIEENHYAEVHGCGQIRTWTGFSFSTTYTFEYICLAFIILTFSFFTSTGVIFAGSRHLGYAFTSHVSFTISSNTFVGKKRSVARWWKPVAQTRSLIHISTFVSD